MISTSDLQALIEKIEGGSQGVDLVKIGQNYAQQGEYWKWKISSRVYFNPKMVYFVVPARPLRRFRVALDIEGCIDRFYGGYYSGKLNLLFPYVCLFL
jgi:hypothetical protein